MKNRIQQIKEISEGPMMGNLDSSQVVELASLGMGAVAAIVKTEKGERIGASLGSIASGSFERGLKRKDSRDGIREVFGSWYSNGVRCSVWNHAAVMGLIPATSVHFTA